MSSSASNATTHPEFHGHERAENSRQAPAALWKRTLRRDSVWFGVAAATALALGVAGDQFLREQPLGWRYQMPALRVLAGAAAVNLASLEETQALLARPEVIVLDARPRVFYELGHLPGAQSLSREYFDRDFSAIESAVRAPGRTLLVYCADASCEDGALVVGALQQRGISSLVLFPGGIAEWEAAGQSLEVAP